MIDNKRVIAKLQEAANGIQKFKATFREFDEVEFEDVINNEEQLISLVDEMLDQLYVSAQKQFVDPIITDIGDEGVIYDNRVNVFWESRDAVISFMWRPFQGKIRFFLYAVFEEA